MGTELLQRWLARAFVGALLSALALEAFLIGWLSTDWVNGESVLSLAAFAGVASSAVALGVCATAAAAIGAVIGWRRLAPEATAGRHLAVRRAPLRV